MKLNDHSNKILISLIAMFFLSAISACKKLVDIDQPINTLTTVDVFNTNLQANSALAGVYSQLETNSGLMIFSNGATSIYAGLSADELVSYSGAAGSANYQFETNALISTNANPNSYFWQPAYRIINNVNAIIEGSAASTSSLLADSVRVQITGECKFIRAFSYFYLTNFFGNIPLTLTSNYNNTIALSNSLQADVYKQINKDLIDAQNTLKTDYSVSGATGERIRANKWAATALLARAYLYEQDWVDAEAQATSVINNSQFALVSNLSNVFLKNSTETILQFQQNISPNLPFSGTFEGTNFIPGTIITNLTPAQQAVDLAPAQFLKAASQYIPAFYLSTQLAGAFEANDKRKTTWVGYTPTPVAAPYTGTNIYWAYKYTLAQGSPTVPPAQYYMVLRLAEQYLIRAEARAQQGNMPGAAADLNAIRSRAGLSATTAASQASMLAAIAHERQVELFCEWGHRFFDLKRTGQATGILSAIISKQPWNNYQLLYPIPPSEITADGFLHQNPGY